MRSIERLAQRRSFNDTARSSIDLILSHKIYRTDGHPTSLSLIRLGWGGLIRRPRWCSRLIGDESVMKATFENMSNETRNGQAHGRLAAPACPAA
jgi:hypothetical protein